MPLPNQCNLCDGFYVKSKVIGICDQCAKEIKDGNCSHPTSYLGCCTYCGKDKNNA